MSSDGGFEFKEWVKSSKKHETTKFSISEENERQNLIETNYTIDIIISIARLYMKSRNFIDELHGTSLTVKHDVYSSISTCDTIDDTYKNSQKIKVMDNLPHNSSNTVNSDFYFNQCPYALFVYDFESLQHAAGVYRDSFFDFSFIDQPIILNAAYQSAKFDNAAHSKSSSRGFSDKRSHMKTAGHKTHFEKCPSQVRNTCSCYSNYLDRYYTSKMSRHDEEEDNTSEYHKHSIGHRKCHCELSDNLKMAKPHLRALCHKHKKQMIIRPKNFGGIQIGSYIPHFDGTENEISCYKHDEEVKCGRAIVCHCIVSDGGRNVLLTLQNEVRLFKICFEHHEEIRRNSPGARRKPDWISHSHYFGSGFEILCRQHQEHMKQLCKSYGKKRLFRLDSSMPQKTCCD